MPQQGGLREATQAMAEFHRQFAARVRGLLRNRRARAWELVLQMWPNAGADPQGARSSLSEVLAALTWLAGQGAVCQGADGCWEECRTEEAVG